MTSAKVESMTVVGNLLRKEENGKLVKVLSFRPKVRVGNDHETPSAAIKAAITDTVGKGWTTVRKTDDWAMVTSESLSASNMVVHFGFVRSGSRCPSCGALRSAPNSWCGDKVGCDKFRKQPTNKRMNKRAGFGAI